MARKNEFGITRLGSVTNLDWIGIPVVQVVRPQSLSVTVSQGKGMTFPLAAISALMESLEGWASERIAPDSIFTAPFRESKEQGLWSHLGVRDTAETLTWIDGVDLFSGLKTSVPLGLVDTAYTIPSPHPKWVPRDTSGLAASASVQHAVLHACFEILERQARCSALETPHFFDRFQINTQSVTAGLSGEIVIKVRAAGFGVGIWRIPTAHEFPVYWVHIMENGEQAPFAPLPAEGFGCAFTHDNALASALLEACQSRLGVISAAREDVRTDLYSYPGASELAGWRAQLAKGERTYQTDVNNGPLEDPLRRILTALQLAGAQAAILVHLHSDERIPLHVAKVIAPPLETNPEFHLAW
ncbi:YcaO-like family protein [Rhizobium indicum]|uniref:YcaO-like family protein n=1 Tax=Rhizobium indicum TaxID=2583231 RepID=UPI0031B5EB25